ncbi:spore germination protein [Paenibacillus abyssi]|uniref:Spore germination protein n=1 Tax=Paenibacillus abyssi TaxID=1340531 RepID=A0A917D2T4_9BACL|nr:spore germination protein [Paenibacillus abyssi]GGG06133.1 spore germination protein [Paenibacillus abyssi]
MNFFRSSGKNRFNEVQKAFEKCEDIVYRTFPQLDITLIYFDHLVEKLDLDRDVIRPLNQVTKNDLQGLFKQSQFERTQNAAETIESILNGKVAVFHGDDTYVVNAYGPASRAVVESETESVITGPHDAFTENLNTNLALIRRRVKSSKLKTIKLSVGEITKTSVYICYIEGIANDGLVQELIKRVKNIETDGIFEGNMFVQFIDEHPHSVFPQFITSERTDVIASKLIAGKIAGLVEGSPSAFTAPTNFFEFFSSPDDYYQRWMLGTALRLLRFIAFIITITFTAFYVSVTTFHYEMIPQALLLNLAESRSKVPFPPLYEALLMELTIELLREAGARLPSKIGQTIGIVGGIVIGQAAVQAGLTSNILIIAVASSAIASFVIPSYIMSASIRLIRFGLIVLAGNFGNWGLMFGIALIVIHLCGLTNLGTSYLTPVAPMNANDWKDTFVRFPFSLLVKRPSQVKTPNKRRMK